MIPSNTVTNLILLIMTFLSSRCLRHILFPVMPLLLSLLLTSLLFQRKLSPVSFRIHHDGSCFHINTYQFEFLKLFPF